MTSSNLTKSVDDSGTIGDVVSLPEDIWLIVVSFLSNLRDIRSFALVNRKMLLMAYQLGNPIIVMSSLHKLSSYQVPANIAGIVIASNQEAVVEDILKIIPERNNIHTLSISKCFKLDATAFINHFLPKCNSNGRFSTGFSNIALCDLIFDFGGIALRQSTSNDTDHVYLKDTTRPLEVLVLTNTVFKSQDDLAYILSGLLSPLNKMHKTLRFIGLGGVKWEDDRVTNHENTGTMTGENDQDIGCEIDTKTVDNLPPSLFVEVTHLSQSQRCAIKRMMLSIYPAPVVFIDLLLDSVESLKALLLYPQEKSALDGYLRPGEPYFKSMSSHCVEKPFRNGSMKSLDSSAVAVFSCAISDISSTSRNSTHAVQEESSIDECLQVCQHIATNCPIPTVMRTALSNCADTYTSTPLHHACRQGDEERVNFLTSAMSARFDLKDAKGFTALHRAAASNQTRCIHILLHRSPTAYDMATCTSTGRNHLMKHLCGANQLRETPLYLTSFYGHAESTKLLLTYFPPEVAGLSLADFLRHEDAIWKQEQSLWSFIDYLEVKLLMLYDLELGNMRKLRLQHLIDYHNGLLPLHGTFLDFIQSEFSFFSPLHAAVIAQSIPCVQMLLNCDTDAGANDVSHRAPYFSPNYRNKNEETPLHLAMQTKNRKNKECIIRLLLQAGADPNIASGSNERYEAKSTNITQQQKLQQKQLYMKRNKNHRRSK